jgi:stage III sporulation protein AA
VRQVVARGLTEIISFIAPSVRNVLELLPLSIVHDIEEVRLRLNRPLAVRLDQHEYFIDHKGQTSP